MKKTIKATVTVADGSRRMDGRRVRKKDRFVACFKLGGGSTKLRLSESCAWGSNPRKAVAGAFRRIASSIGKRSGRYHGL